MIKINGKLWRVRLVPPQHPVLYRNGNPAVGCCDDTTKTIYISNAVSQEFMKKILCHEMVHAAMYSYNVPMSDAVEEIVAGRHVEVLQRVFEGGKVAIVVAQAVVAGNVEVGVIIQILRGELVAVAKVACVDDKIAAGVLGTLLKLLQCVMIGAVQHPGVVVQIGENQKTHGEDLP